MRETIYRCDQCKVPTGDNKHISVKFDGYSGIAMLSEAGIVDKPKWHIVNRISGTKQFCSSNCISQYFDGLLKASK